MNRQKLWRKRKLEAGLCVQCGGEKPGRGDKILCAKCAKKQTAANKRALAKKVIDCDLAKE